MDDVGAFAGTVRAADSVVALTGAGASTASGVPDFRGEDGDWDRFDQAAFTIDRYRRNPGEFWDGWLRLHDDRSVGLPSSAQPARPTTVTAAMRSRRLRRFGVTHGGRREGTCTCRRRQSTGVGRLPAVGRPQVLVDALGLGHRHAVLVVDEHGDLALAAHRGHLVALGVQSLDPDAVELEVEVLQYVDDRLAVWAAFEPVEGQAHVHEWASMPEKGGAKDDPFANLQSAASGIPTVHRIRLDNTEFEGNNAAYLFDGERTTLVDTGVAVPDVREQVRAGLADHGVAVADLDAILLTHWHVDHAALAGAFQAESGATVYAHPLDAPLVERDPDAEAALADVRDRKFAEWGMPDEQINRLHAFFEASSGAQGEGADVTPLEDGDTVRAGEEALRAVTTPGHTDGHLAYVREAGPEPNTVLTGDALLPKYTPNVGGADPRVEGPLGKYLDTLDWLAVADFDRAYPGHRDPIDEPSGRAQEIVGHHQERAERVLDYLREEGPADAWTVSAHLFGGLDGIHIMHGPGEAYAHLEHMARHGLVVQDDGQYTAVEESLDLSALFP
jgi:glyoxylase-like metal-dependent hydrolase (beta-lactamase superfamily II)